MRILRLLSILVLLVSSLTDVYAARPQRKKQIQEDTLALSCLGVAERFSDVLTDIDTRLDFYSSKGYTHYFYTPTDDRYCNAWGWKFLYNDGDRKMLRELNEKCSSKGLEFTWTVSPGEGYGWTEKDYDFLKNKLLMMYYNGIRSFAVRFSSESGDFKAVEDSLRSYLTSSLPKAELEVRVLNNIPDVTYPSGEDAARSLMKGYHFDEQFCRRASAADAVVCVLTEKDELSRTALMAAAECARDPFAYKADVAMEKGIMTLSPEVKEPLMTFLSHTGGVEESASVSTFKIDDWTPEKAAVLRAEFEKIERVPEEMAECSSPVLLEGLRPWLVEFGKLGSRGLRTLKALQYYKEENLGDFWLAYVDNMMSDEEKESYRLHPVGEQKLYPFCINIMDELTERFTSIVTGGVLSRNLDFASCVPSGGHIEFLIPSDSNTCRLLTGPIPEGKQILFRQLAEDGSLVAEFEVTSPYSEYDLKSEAVMVDVMGDVDIYETIFVYL